jgi:hypothetical protein
MEQIENGLNTLINAFEQSVKEFSATKDLAEKKTRAEIIKLLSDSLGIFFTAAKSGGPDDFFGDDDNDDDYDDYFLDDEVIPKALPPKGKKGKRGKKEDLPF